MNGKNIGHRMKYIGLAAEEGCPNGDSEISRAVFDIYFL